MPLKAKAFYDAICAQQEGVTPFFGVPDSLLKDFNAFVTDNVPVEANIIAANEGAAVGLAVGYYLASRRIACVYMQNSGTGSVSSHFSTIYSLYMKFILFECVCLLVVCRRYVFKHFTV